MKKILLTACASLCVLVSTAGHAAKPEKIIPGPEGVKDGESFRNYTVECSNGKRQPLTAWRGGKEWCVGLESTENCSKKQIKAAQDACKLD